MSAHAPTLITRPRRLCVLCMRYKPPVSGSQHAPGLKPFICAPCVEKRYA